MLRRGHMAEENIRSTALHEPPQSDFVRKWLIRAAVVLAAFLIGLVPMWLSKRSVDSELVQTKRELRRDQLQNGLAAAAVYARRGEYETARQNASTFFTDMQTELNNADSTLFSPQEKTQMPAILSSRDDVITLLSRGDPAAAERLSNLYVDYRSATALHQP